MGESLDQLGGINLGCAERALSLVEQPSARKGGSRIRDSPSMIVVDIQDTRVAVINSKGARSMSPDHLNELRVSPRTADGSR